MTHTAPVSWWVPTITSDATDNAGTNDGTLNGTTIVSDTGAGGAEAFNNVAASSQYVGCGDFADSLFDGSNDKCLLSVWVKANTNAVSQSICSKYDQGTTPAHRTFLCSLISQKVRVAWYQDGATNNIVYNDTDDNQITSTGTWYHVGASCDLSTGTIVIYVNGSSVASTKNTIGTAPTTCENTTVPFELLRAGPTLGWHFDGRIDDLRIDNTIWTAGNFSELYDSGNGRGYEPAAGGIVQLLDGGMLRGGLQTMSGGM